MDGKQILELKEQFAKKLPECKKCELYERPFCPSYYADTDVIIIGEAPGADEIEKKIPFVGRSGALLRRKLTDVGFDPESITFLNACKCRPPLDDKNQNTPPNRKTINKCKKLFLEKELAALKGNRLVILAGMTPTSVFFPKVKKIGKVAGEFKKIDAHRFYPIYHPSFILRSQNMAQRFTADLRRANDFITGALHKHKKYHLLTHEREVTDAIDMYLEQEAVVFDIETNQTLDPFDPNMAIHTISFCSERNKAVCIPLDHPSIESVKFREHCWSEVKRFMESGVGKVAHNACFDIKILKHYGIKTVNLVGDTMVFAFLLNENRYSIGLKQLSQELLNGCVYEWSENLEELSLYNCEDTDNCLALYKLFLPELKKHVRMKKLFDEVLVPLIYVIGEMELNGIALDKKAAIDLANELEEHLDALREGLFEDFPESKDTNMRSVPQLRKLMYEKLKYPIYKYTDKTMLPSTDAETLERLAYEGYSFQNTY